MIWLLSGLLLVAVGLLVGFDSKAAIGAMIGGLLISVFGVILYFLQLQERPRQSTQTRLSSDFISVGATTQTPSPQVDNERAAEQPATE